MNADPLEEINDRIVDTKNEQAIFSAALKTPKLSLEQDKAAHTRELREEKERDRLERRTHRDAGNGGAAAGAQELTFFAPAHDLNAAGDNPAPMQREVMADV